MSSEHDRPQISVVIPVHNEAETIEQLLNLIEAAILSKIPGELIVAEDGSSDSTVEVLSKLASRIPMRLHTSHERKGYAKAAKDALSLARGSLVFFIDSDGQYHPQEFWQLYEKMNSADMIIGRKLHRADPLHRIILADVWNWLLRRIFLVGLHDCDCGFRILTPRVLERVLPRVGLIEAGFWSEFTVRAVKAGFLCREVPVSHFARAHGETTMYPPSKLLRIVLNQLVGMLRLEDDLRRG